MEVESDLSPDDCRVNSGVVVFEITAADGQIPNGLKLGKQFTKRLVRENLH